MQYEKSLSHIVDALASLINLLMRILWELLWFQIDKKLRNLVLNFPRDSDMLMWVQVFD